MSVARHPPHRSRRALLTPDLQDTFNAASVRYRIAIEPRSGQKTLTLHSASLIRTPGRIADADQLLLTFSALLRINRIEAGGLRPAMEKVDVSAMVYDAAELYEAVAEDSQLTLVTRIGGSWSIRGDRDLPFQAITNLLDNAVKYTPAGGEIILSAVGYGP